MSEMEDFALYLKLSEWKSGYNLIPYQSEETKKKVSMLGIYNPKTNKDGLVRDHRLSRKDGFKLKCFPELLRHPANCQFITNSENAQKQCHSDIDVDTLLSQVLEFQPTWVEQEVCVKLVERYRNGERYERYDY